MRWVVAVALLQLGACDHLFGISDPQPSELGADAATEVEPGLVAHYMMETIDDGVAVDSVGHHDGRCASMTQCPTVTTGAIGNGFAFNGTTNRVEVLGGGDLETTASFTVAAWLQVITPPGGNCPVNKVLGSTIANSWQICVFGDYNVDFITCHDTVSPSDQLFTATTNGALIPNQWVHIAIRYDGAIKAIFVDGVLNTTASSAGVPPLFDGSPVELGADFDNGLDTTAGFGGLVDDVRIYNVALASDEIATLAAR